VINRIKNFFLYFSQIYHFLSPKNKKKVLKITIGFVIVMFLEVLSIGIIYPVVSLALSEQNFFDSQSWIEIDFLNTISKSELLFYVLTILIFVFLIKNIFMIFFIIYKTKFNEDFTSNLRIRLYDGYLKQEYNDFIETPSPNILRNISVEAGTITRVLDAYLGIFAEVIALAGIVSFLIFIAPLPTFIIIVLSALFLLVYIFSFKRKFFLLGVERFKLDSKVMSEIQQGLGNYKEINIYNIRSIFIDKFRMAVTKLNKNLRKSNTITLCTRIVLEQYGIFIIVILSFFVLSSLDYKSSAIPLLGSYVYAFFKLLPSMNKMALSFHQITNGKISVSHIDNELKRFRTNNLKLLDVNNKKVIKFKNSININNIDFEFNNKDIFKNLSLEIGLNQKIGLMGLSGSGKSSLLNLIMGFLTPTKGNIEFDKVDIKNNAEYIRKKIGYVSQSIYLMNDSLKNNITLRQDNEDVDEVKLNEAIRVSGLDAFVKNLEEGVNTVLNEHATNISGGEKQRIVIARALYYAKEILLFDEFTSSLDTKTENEILEQVNKIDKTTIIVSHKLSTLKYCDKVYIIENKGIKKIDVK
jgi:ATP-binding cassette, subfamily B, bacterial PglK